MSKTKKRAEPVKVADATDESSASSDDDVDTEIPADIAIDALDEDDVAEPSDDEDAAEPPVDVIETPGLVRAQDDIKVIVVVAPEKMRTPSTMSLFEMTEHGSIRGAEISRWNNCMVDTTGLDDPVDMAKRELMMRRSPLELRRHVGDLVVDGKVESYYEIWSPNDMIFSTHFNV